MSAADMHVATERARRRLAAEARLGGQYQSVVMAIHKAAMNGEFEVTVKFHDHPHAGILPALEDDGYDVAWDDDLTMDISW